jgi:hypothetical protein
MSEIQDLLNVKIVKYSIYLGQPFNSSDTIYFPEELNTGSPFLFCG